MVILVSMPLIHFPLFFLGFSMIFQWVINLSRGMHIRPKTIVFIRFWGRYAGGWKYLKTHQKDISGWQWKNKKLNIWNKKYKTSGVFRRMYTCGHCILFDIKSWHIKISILSLYLFTNEIVREHNRWDRIEASGIWHNEILHIGKFWSMMVWALGRCRGWTACWTAHRQFDQTAQVDLHLNDYV